ncbi:CarD family transcriptional regulator, partial [Bacteroidota bacterium]
MNNKEIINLFSERKELAEISNLLASNERKPVSLKNLSGSASSMLIISLFNNNPGPYLLVLNDREEAAYVYNDINSMLGEKKVYFFPSSFKRSVQYDSTDQVNILMRTECLNKYNNRNKNFILVTYPEAIMEKVITKRSLKKNTLQLKTGENISTKFLIEVLNEYEFERNDFVYEPGQYSVRGSIIDIFSYSGEYPYRIDFFGDEVESIRSFNIETQLSKEKLRSITIIPNIQEKLLSEQRDSFLNFIPSETIIWLKEPEYILNRIDTIYKDYVNSIQDDSNEISEKLPVSELIEGRNSLKEKLIDFPLIESKQYFSNKEDRSIKFNTSPQPVFNKNYDLLRKNLEELSKESYRNIILFPYEKQIERLNVILNTSEESKLLFEPALYVLHEGFIDHDLKICFYTDHQIFDRYHKFTFRKAFRKKESIKIKELTSLQPGDYIVHVDHGIGQFGGLQTIDNHGKKHESIRLVYKDQDILYVSIHSLHRISKYKGKDGEKPKIYKLGSGAWQKLKT